MQRKSTCISFFILFGILLISCSSDSTSDVQDDDDTPGVVIQYTKLPIRTLPRPETTPDVPHVQIGVEPVPAVHEELIRRAYTIPGVEDLPSVIAGWRGLSLSEGVMIHVTDALIGDREFGHIHDDGSLHIFLEPVRASEAVEAGWAIDHPFAVQGLPGWDGFVMLYTPQSLEELDTTLQLIVDGYNYVTGQNYQFAD